MFIRLAPARLPHAAAPSTRPRLRVPSVALLRRGFMDSTYRSRQTDTNTLLSIMYSQPFRARFMERKIRPVSTEGPLVSN